MDLYKSMQISASGMKAQGTRLRVISENIANADSTGETPGAQPYRRKVVTFGETMDRELKVPLVQVKNISTDQSEFTRKYDPGHPAADKDGYVLIPNVNPLIEVTDMREAQRSYEANLKVLETTRSMLENTLGILR
ncbi:flagellar basal-body rod protein FlgC [Tistlia consotensis]|uniref:Flagellar basal-body rod protein FlgC n=1 Tax=Tistlia consotensis USBA 355 TaxID=560819 RepID=A0A1Y6CJ28_9PROT|nr:flagellar basal body rod protein FlgC [Tistlia consotensis]SMF68155.1 flagellar basal-body rod protein FlgC [Tistlia consotensis USBA 355]SNR98959.1 flagellar basal-body rod protein FlgC [Tistlia consotensis]